MRKFLLSCIMLISSFNLLDAAAQYTPTTGPLNLSDAANTTTRGSIMQIVINNNPAIAGVANPTLAQANAAISIFDGQGQNFRPYQQIMTNLRQATNTTQALEALTAFETILMHMYDYRAYMVGTYKPVQSIFVTGIRWSWINPICYISPKSWLSDNDAELKQIIDELDQIADIATFHSALVGTRIKTTVSSYRNWRRNVLLGTAAYLAANMYRQGYDKSIVNIISTQGIVPGCVEIGKNIKSDTTKGIQTGYSYSTWAAKGTWDNVIKPFSNRLLFGPDKDIPAKKPAVVAKKTTQESLHITAYMKDSWNDYIKKLKASAIKKSE